MQPKRAEKETIHRLEQVLMRASETVGDLTKPSMDLFYSRHPEAIEAFKHHGFDKRERLEAEMVDTALYCVMSWLEQPVEVEIMLCGSVPHHHDTLKVRPDWYRGLLGSVIDVIAQTVPENASDDTELIERIHMGLFDAIERSEVEMVTGIVDR